MTAPDAQSRSCIGLGLEAPDIPTRNTVMKRLEALWYQYSALAVKCFRTTMEFVIQLGASCDYWPLLLFIRLYSPSDIELARIRVYGDGLKSGKGDSMWRDTGKILTALWVTWIRRKLLGITLYWMESIASISWSPLEGSAASLWGAGRRAGILVNSSSWQRCLTTLILW